MLCMVGDSKPYIINDDCLVSMISQYNWNIGQSNEKQYYKTCMYVYWIHSIPQ